MTGNADQAEFWSNSAGRKWVRLQSQIDQLMQEITSGMFARADLRPGQAVLDIGCGTGESTVLAAAAAGPAGHVTGVDISPTMLDLARRRTDQLANVTLMEADAESHAFAPASFDRLISRFGLMFFENPVAAFANMRGALRPGARISFVCWGTIAGNPWFTAPAQAARAHLGAPPPVDPDAPGPFAFREADRVLDILATAGFNNADVEVTQIRLRPEGSALDAAMLSTNLGPAVRTIEHFAGSEADAEAIARITARTFAAFETPEGLSIPAELNFCTATAP